MHLQPLRVRTGGLADGRPVKVLEDSHFTANINLLLHCLALLQVAQLANHL